jgi:CMP-N,N'-diacetyllegionaminic acid synthase
MLNGKKVWAIIPARGGSKGIPRKNLYKLGNETILERTIRLAKSCVYVDEVVVSTDDHEMYEIAKKHGVNSPALRPEHLATDEASTIDVVLDLMKELNICDAYVLLLQTTSPLRNEEDIKNLFKEFEAKIDKADAIVSLTAHSEPHPNKIQKIEGDYVASYLGCESSVPRQSLPKVFKLNGAFYMIDSEILKKEKTFIPKKTIPFVMPEERSVNIDHPYDLCLLETLIERGIVNVD